MDVLSHLVAQTTAGQPVLRPWVSPIKHLVAQTMGVKLLPPRPKPPKTKATFGPKSRKYGPIIEGLREQGLNNEAIAQHLGMSRSAVANHTYRYIRAVKEGLI